MIAIPAKFFHFGYNLALWPMYTRLCFAFILVYLVFMALVFVITRVVAAFISLFLSLCGANSEFIVAILLLRLSLQNVKRTILHGSLGSQIFEKVETKVL